MSGAVVTKVCKGCGNEITRYGSGNWWQSVGQRYDRCRNAVDGKHEPAKVGALSPVQQDAMDTARANGGRLVRLPGGFWTFPGCEVEQRYTGSDPVPSWHVGTNTIKGLLRKGVLVEVDWRTGVGFSRTERYCVAVQVAPEETP